MKHAFSLFLISAVLASLLLLPVSAVYDGSTDPFAGTVITESDDVGDAVTGRLNTVRQNWISGIRSAYRILEKTATVFGIIGVCFYAVQLMTNGSPDSAGRAKRRIVQILISVAAIRFVPALVTFGAQLGAGYAVTSFE